MGRAVVGPWRSAAESCAERVVVPAALDKRGAARILVATLAVALVLVEAGLDAVASGRADARSACWVEAAHIPSVWVQMWHEREQEAYLGAEAFDDAQVRALGLVAFVVVGRVSSAACRTAAAAEVRLRSVVAAIDACWPCGD